MQASDASKTNCVETERHEYHDLSNQCRSSFAESHHYVSAASDAQLKPCASAHAMKCKNLPEALQNVLEFDTLNKVQSSCYEAFSGDGNLIVSAPTGSGKTAVFEMAICRLIERASREKNMPGSQCKFLGKVVYLAPIKSLCHEKAMEWSRKLSRYNIRVAQVTGDEPNSFSISRILPEYDIILSTPEKFDAVTRQYKGPNTHSLASMISLILIDEVHHVGHSRGGALEAVVTRMILASDQLKCSENESLRRLPGSKLRIIAASGTIPNIDDLGDWLKVDANMRKIFSQSYRPVPLDVKVLGYKPKNVWKFDAYLDDRLFQVIQEYSSGRPALVFCPTKRSCFTAATAVSRKLRHGMSNFSLRENAFCWKQKQLLAVAMKMFDKTARDLLSQGLAVHHGDLSTEHRDTVERLFGARILNVLFTTTTLAQGVNLPARLCVIKGTCIYQNGSLREYDRNLVTQMLGRAGRPQYDDKGVAIIMTQAGSAAMYEGICHGKHDTVKSQLEQGLVEHVNAEISRLVIYDFFTAIKWLKATYYYVRKRKLWCKTEQELEEEICNVMTGILRRLSASNIIVYEEKYHTLRPQTSCQVMSRYYLSLGTMTKFIESAHAITSPVEALKLLSSANEFTDDVYIRRSERRTLNDLNDTLRYPLKTKVKLPADKVFVLLQASLADGEGSTIGDCSLKRECLKLSQTSSRLARALCHYVAELGSHASFTSTHAVLNVSRSLKNRVFWDSRGAIRQIPGIGTAFANKLGKAGANSVCALAAMDPRQIEANLSKNPPFGNEILSKLSVIPRLHVEVERKVSSEHAFDTGTARFKIRVSLCAWGSAIPSNASTMTPYCAKRGLLKGNGFVLAGCHGTKTLLYETFTINSLTNCSKTFYVSVPTRAGKDLCSSWLDVLAGPCEYCGVDMHQRIPIFQRNESTFTEKSNERDKTDQDNRLHQASTECIHLDFQAKSCVNEEQTATSSPATVNNIVPAVVAHELKTSENEQALLNTSPIQVVRAQYPGSSGQFLPLKRTSEQPAELLLDDLEPEPLTSTESRDVAPASTTEVSSLYEKANCSIRVSQSPGVQVTHLTSGQGVQPDGFCGTKESYQSVYDLLVGLESKKCRYFGHAWPSSPKAVGEHAENIAHAANSSIENDGEHFSTSLLKTKVETSESEVVKQIFSAEFSKSREYDDTFRGMFS